MTHREYLRVSWRLYCTNNWAWGLRAGLLLFICWERPSAFGFRLDFNGKIPWLHETLSEHSRGLTDANIHDSFFEHCKWWATMCCTRTLVRNNALRSKTSDLMLSEVHRKDFPIFDTLQETKPPQVYLDHAATTPTPYVVTVSPNNVLFHWTFNASLLRWSMQWRAITKQATVMCIAQATRSPCKQQPCMNNHARL